MPTNAPPGQPRARPPISVLLPTFNCEGTVRATLESVRWADEILVVDSYSTDGTLDVCRSYGAHIIQHEYITSARQKNWAIPQCAHSWVLEIDSDEVVTPELQAEIESAVAHAPDDVHAFRMPRRNYMLGRWLRHGGVYPDYQIRVVRRDLGRWQDRQVHAHIQVPGRVETLHHDLIHHDIPSLAKPLRNLDRYTRYEATELVNRGVRFRRRDLVLRPVGVFLYRYGWLGGFRDGWRGLILAAYWAAYIFFTRAKLWEYEQSHRRGSAAGTFSLPLGGEALGRGGSASAPPPQPSPTGGEGEEVQPSPTRGEGGHRAVLMAETRTS